LTTLATANLGGLTCEFRSNQPNDDAADRTDAENWHEHLGNNRWRQTKQYPDRETDQPSRARYVDSFAAPSGGYALAKIVLAFDFQEK
jgi:hypothetical protein